MASPRWVLVYLRQPAWLEPLYLSLSPFLSATPSKLNAAHCPLYVCEVIGLLLLVHHPDHVSDCYFSHPAPSPHTTSALPPPRMTKFVEVSAVTCAKRLHTWWQGYGKFNNVVRSLRGVQHILRRVCIEGLGCSSA